MVCFIDIHAHLDDDQFHDDIDNVIDAAKSSAVHVIVNQGTNSESNRRSLYLSRKYPEVKAALGFYPLEAIKVSPAEFDEEIEFIRKSIKKIYAIGEVGLDKHWDKDEDHFRLQIERFKKLVQLSTENNLPIIVHSRKAEDETIGLLEVMKAKKVLMHCFGGKMTYVDRIVKNGWYMSIPTSVAYDGHFQNIVENAPLSHLFCETDSPYLGPIKGERNEPAKVVESYKMIAEIKKMELEDVKNNIFLNYQRLFS